MVLNGDPDMVLKSITIDGAALDSSAFEKTPSKLTILSPPAEFELCIVTELRPQDNTSLEGLYKSSGNFCTQCEAESFRRITFFPDREPPGGTMCLSPRELQDPRPPNKP